MSQKEEKISQKNARHQINLGLRRAALLYHYFAETLIDQLGEDKGKDLIRKAIHAYGDHIGSEAGKRARTKGLALEPENYQDDLPDLAWEWEAVKVEGEDRVRVHHCPLAAQWLEWGDPQTARLYCYVDQAKMRGFNPDYEYIHVKNLLDGDPYCELVIRPVSRGKTKAQERDLQKGGQNERDSKQEREETVWSCRGSYTKDDLKKMEPACLRALFRERIHHTVEVELYPILLGIKKARPNIGTQPQLILNVWRERGLPEDGPDWEWGKTYLALAEKLRAGEEIQLDTALPRPFTDEEMQTVNKLIWERRSIRNWVPGKEIPDNLITQILEAGRAAPTGCNLDVVRFVVVRDPDKAKMVWSDIPTPMERCVLIIICYDKRIYETVGYHDLVPHNQLLDAAAAADHMGLMAHALGLGAVWLTCTEKTALRFKQEYGLPEYIEQVCHMAVGWPALGTIKSQRMPLEEMLIK